MSRPTTRLMISSSDSPCFCELGGVVVAEDAGRRRLERARADRRRHEHAVAPHDRRRPAAAGHLGRPTRRCPSSTSARAASSRRRRRRRRDRGTAATRLADRRCRPRTSQAGSRPARSGRVASCVGSYVRTPRSPKTPAKDPDAEAGTSGPCRCPWYDSRRRSGARTAWPRPPRRNSSSSTAGRSTVSNPGKVLFPTAGHTKLDLVRYYLAVADGALRAAGGRPNVLVRYPNGIDDEFFYQKRAPQSRPEWLEVVALKFPSGRTAEEVVPRTPAALAWMANLACLELHPHPVRAEDLDHPDELRIDLDPVPGIEWPQLREVARSCARRWRTSGWSGGRRPPGRVASTSTCGSSRRGDSTRCAGRRWRSPAKSSGGRQRWRPASGGRKSATACSSTTTRTPRIAPSRPPTRCGRSRTRASPRR